MKYDDDLPPQGSLAWLNRELELGTATFPDLVPAPSETPRVAFDLEEDGAAYFGSAFGERPGEGGWCW